MDKPFKFALPPPNFSKNIKDACKAKPHFLTPSGMSLLPREKQPPPMYGKHGATVPARYLPQQSCDNRQPEQQTIVDPPEKQYCEPCELEFHCLDDLKRHRAQHEKCPVAGCTFKGHSSVMDKHVSALHASGLFDKFKKLSTPEEIAAWREERRKRYPTLANVLLKQKAQEQKQKRGERLEANKSRFGKTNDRKRAQPQDKNQNEMKTPREESKMNNKNNKRNRKNKQKQNLKNPNKTAGDRKDNAKNLEKEQNEEINHLERCGIKMFCGTSHLKDYEHFSDKKKAVKNNALFGLVGMYGSDDDDDEDNSEEENVVNTERLQIEQENSKLVNEDKLNVNNSVNVDNCMESTDNEEPITNKLNNTGIDQKDVQKDLTNDNKSLELVQETLLDARDNNIKEFAIDQPQNTPIENLPSNVNENSSDEGPEEVPIERISHDLVSSKANTASTPVANNEPAAKRSKLEDQPKTTLKQKIVAKRKYGLDYRKARLRKQNTMLEKLLETDIRHERNVLLQCVRYVCENNYFGIGQNSPNKPG